MCAETRTNTDIKHTGEMGGKGRNGKLLHRVHDKMKGSKVLSVLCKESDVSKRQVRDRRYHKMTVHKHK